MIIRKIILFIIAVHFFYPLSLNAAERIDTIALPNEEKQCRFNAKQLILPGTLIAIGASSLFFEPMKDLEHSVQNNIADLKGNDNNRKIDDYLRFAPTAINFALHFAGVKSPYNTRDQLLLTATSFTSVYILTQGLKHVINRTRPDGSDNHSFPSGHVATAFLGAEQLRINYGTWWGLAGYTIATVTAFLRLYNNRHWLGDVISAAGIGILSTRIGYWLLPLEKKLLGLDKNDTKLLALPTYSHQDNSYGIAFTLFL